MKLTHVVGGLVGLVGATWLFWAGIWWDAGRPAGWPSYTARLGPFHHTFSLPDGYGAKYRADEASRKAWAAALNQCTANGVVLQRAIDGQNSAVEALSAQSVRLTAANAQAVQAARSANARAVSAETSILATPLVGNDVCARAEDVDRRLLETLP